MVREALPDGRIRTRRQGRQVRLAIAGRAETRSSRSTTNSMSRRQKVAAFLKNASDGKGVFNVDIFALEKESAAATANDQVLVAPLGLTSFSLAAGETLVADVVIQNKGIGHSLHPRAARLL